MPGPGHGHKTTRQRGRSERLEAPRLPTLPVGPDELIATLTLHHLRQAERSAGEHAPGIT